MPLLPTPRHTLYREGTARLYRFRPPATPARAEAASGVADLPVLLVPSLINRWDVMDLRPGASLAGAFVEAGLDTFLLDWGVPHDEDRHLDWEAVLARLARAVRRVKRQTGAPRIGLLGYCMGGTLAGIHAATHPDDIAAFVNLAGPFDFSKAGMLGEMVDPRWFDAAAISAAGNVGATQMQAGFAALRPTLPLAKWVGFLDRAHDAASRASFDALEEWSSDNIPFPAAAYSTYITELYQQNRLMHGTHHVAGRRVDLGAIACPVMSVSAERDTICPPAAARGLLEASRAATKEDMVVPGGHVGAVVGARAASTLYPALTRFFGTWLRSDACNSPN